jgi:hypothetical protein
MKGMIATVLIAALGTAQAALPAPLLTFAGYGRVEFGMTVAEASQALGATAKADSAAPDSQACGYASFSAYPHARFMIEEGRITRAEVDSAARNALGLTVGMPLTEVRKRFPEVKVTPHKYDDAGHYLIFASRSGKSEIVAEESSGLITVIRGGLLPAVEYVEGCL